MRDRLEDWMAGWDTVELCGCVLALAVADLALALRYGLLGVGAP